MLFRLFLNIFALINFIILFFSSILTSYIPNQRVIEDYSLFLIGFYAVFVFHSYWGKLHYERQISDFIVNFMILLVGILSLVAAPNLFLMIILFRQTFVLLKHLVINAYEGNIYKQLTQNPAVTLMLSFVMTILTGTILLMLPSSSVQGQFTSFIDALFTSTSAVCVTGLTVLDTGTHFSVFGQLIILMLIQVGGLGIMTISTAFAIIIGQRMSVGVEHLMQNVVGENTRLDMFKLVKNIVILTAFVELAGAFFLFFTFRNYTQSTIQAIYYSIFHSISAFCNAGFGLWSDNLMQFLGNWNVNLVITGLIITGGIGFTVLTDVRTTLASKISFSRLSLHTKLVLITTLTLIIVGAILFFIAEYYTTMAGFSLKERALASYFQSVTSRTAGFNTIDETKLTNASALISMILMYIGASPGSTGGGIKTTTFAILILAIFSMIQGSNDVTAFRRKISEQHIKTVLSLIGISLLFIASLIFILMLIEPFSFVKTVFEALSAFGTVGLSMGITPYLSSAGKAIVVILMYIGRIGPLTLIYALSQRKRKFHLEYTEEKIGIG